MKLYIETVITVLIHRKEDVSHAQESKTQEKTGEDFPPKNGIPTKRGCPVTQTKVVVATQDNAAGNPIGSR